MDIENPEDCGMGQGADCCAYLTFAPGGFECGRVHPAIAVLIQERVSSGSMAAKRLPTAPVPDCQIYKAGA